MGGARSEGAYTARVLSHLTSWPGLSTGPADCGSGVALSVQACQLAHLHDGGEAELYLTDPVIKRLADALLHSGRVELRPGADWVRIRLSGEGDVALLLSLLSVAIKVCVDQGCSDRNAPCTVAGRVSAS